jgi:SAM-dependent methyltransferase
MTGDLDAILALHPAPHIPWTHAYARQHRELLGSLLDSPEALELVGGGGRLPAGYGRGFDERVIELVWVLGRRPHGRVLDAGSSLNHAHVLDRVLAVVDELMVTTLVPEEESFPERGISYVYGDFRDLPFRDERFDTVVSISSLEHVGMNNEMYGAEDEGGAEARRGLAAALAEIRRVLVPGGRLLVSVPYGRRENHSWMRQFDAADVEELIRESGLERARVDVFAYAAEGWQISNLEGASEAVYRDYTTDPSPVDDLAAAARAVACIELVKPPA